MEEENIEMVETSNGYTHESELPFSGRTGHTNWNVPSNIIKDKIGKVKEYYHSKEKDK